MGIRFKKKINPTVVYKNISTSVMSAGKTYYLRFLDQLFLYLSLLPMMFSNSTGSLSYSIWYQL